METLLQSHTPSYSDYRRLKKTFLLTSPQKKINIYNKKKRLIFISSLLVLLSVTSVLLLRNFNIIVLAKQHNFAKNSTDLLSNKELFSAELINPRQGAKIIKDIIYLNIPHNGKSGFILNFKDKIDMSNSELYLVVKNPNEDFQVDAILRDTRLFSNARNPISLAVSGLNPGLTYLKIPLEIENNRDINVNLSYIGQLRFIFSQEKEHFLPLFIKAVSLEKRG